ncbi:hypothetical protein Pmar_PMAR028984 [Perkinsus marinus ATCC 50983]|uniref:Uncharacterized protein n=1 Tax=Perkinsus marinus (strain ATCC 50983 / TXsc) TaxID=423536 RepID=C5LJD9_PERM5|nr:hypothetical protein Pmar_PMAR028984 [Perkinsus marinus ATCC 50983]EER03154.1 hypothetical protein Pmar_PMAR028984 [Perkinsus marinus ATCC 50983]|eukprot:XP_002771338.1 hypothetical protein Pmar_PMAR028984 [Perkinsus marinus ATCC 50983]
MPLEEMEPATYSGSANQGTETSSDLVHDLNSLALSIEDDAPECAKQFLESEFLEVSCIRELIGRLSTGEILPQDSMDFQNTYQ